MIEFIVIPFLISFIVGIIAIKKFGLSDDLFLESFYLIKNIEETRENISSLKRSKFEIYIDVLFALSDGSHKLKSIMDSVNLPLKSLQQILNTMISVELIRKEKKGDKSQEEYYITEKGEQTLKYFIRAKNFDDDFDSKKAQIHKNEEITGKIEEKF
jgi:predicted transcriptional regulator